jgi:hypothetical protein
MREPFPGSRGSPRESQELSRGVRIVLRRANKASRDLTKDFGHSITNSRVSIEGSRVSIAAFGVSIESPGVSIAEVGGRNLT